jgi:hypothetical protein
VDDRGPQHRNEDKGERSHGASIPPQLENVTEIRDRTWMRNVLLVIALAAAGCSVSLDDVQQEFAQEFTCPKDKIQVRERKELKPSMLEPKKEPPAEIAADPDRRAMWQTERDEHLRYLDGGQVFEVRGCGHQTLYSCRKNQNRGFVTCTGRPYGDGMARW